MATLTPAEVLTTILEKFQERSNYNAQRSLSLHELISKNKSRAEKKLYDTTSSKTSNKNNQNSKPNDNNNNKISKKLDWLRSKVLIDALLDEEDTTYIEISMLFRSVGEVLPRRTVPIFHLLLYFS